MRFLLHFFIAGICLLGCQSENKQSTISNTTNQATQKKVDTNQESEQQGETDITLQSVEVEDRNGRAPHPELPWEHNAAVYQINTRQFSPAGTINEVSRHIPRLTSLGIKLLEFAPIHPIGKANRKGDLGALESVADYQAINPEFGTIEDFKRLVEAAHANEQKVVIDWVGHHTAYDHVWAKSHDGFYEKSGGKIAMAVDDKGKMLSGAKLAKLDYSNKEMRTAMIEAMRFWIQECNIDGFVCKDAQRIPMNFWKQAKNALASNKKDLLWIADNGGASMHQVFDATGSSALQKLLVDVAKGKVGTARIKTFMDEEKRKMPEDGYRLAYTTNNDLNATQGSTKELLGANEMPTAVVAFTLTGMPALFNGQEAGLDQKLSSTSKDPILWKSKKLSRLYQKLFIMKQTNKAIWNGPFGGEADIFLAKDRQIGFYRTKGPDAVVVMANFDDKPSTVRVDIDKKEMTDIFSRRSIDFSKAVDITIPPHGYMFFQQ